MYVRYNYDINYEVFTKYYTAALSQAQLTGVGKCFTALFRGGAVTWPAIYGHDNKGTEVLDMRKVGESLGSR